MNRVARAISRASIVALLLQFVLQAPATANNPEAVTTSDPGVVVTLPDNSSVVLPCYASGGAVFDDYDGDALFDAAVLQPTGYSETYGCGERAVASDGTVVVGGIVESTSTYRILAFKEGSLIWAHDSVDSCSVNMEPTSVGVSADNRVYFELRSSCQDTSELVTLNLSDGQEMSHTVLQSRTSNASNSIRNFSTGYVYVSDNYDEMVYLDTNGEKDMVRSFGSDYTLPSHSQLWSVGKDGELALLSTQSGLAYCGGDSLGVTVVVLRGVDGAEVRRTVSDDPYNQGCRNQSIYITPSGGAVLGLVNQDGSEYFIAFVGKEGSVPVKVEATTNEHSFGGDVVSVDVYGNTLYAESFFAPDMTDQVRLKLYDASGFLVSQMDTLSLRSANAESFAMIDTNIVATSPGMVHAILQRSGQNAMYHFSFARVGIDYPRGVLRGDTSSPPELHNYVALGDSYSSGEGVEPFIDGTDTSANQCHRSEKAYPELVPLDSELALERALFAACSGATTENLNGINLTNPEPAQLTWLHDEVDVVTISIGGNDIGFGGVVEKCILTSYSECVSAGEEAMDTLTNGSLQREWKDLYSDIRSLVRPNATIIVVGYPDILPDRGDIQGGCTWGSGEFDATRGDEISDVELDNFKAWTDALNSEISLAVDELSDGNIYFVDPRPVFAGHGVCTQEPWINDVSERIDPIDQHWTYHPNEKGQEAYAKLIVETLKDVL